MLESEVLARWPTPFDRIRARASAIAGLDADRLPRRWERVGDVLLLRIPRDLAPWRETIGSIYQEVLRVRTVVEDLAKIHGPWRVPEVRRLCGDGTETIHSENGIRFMLDVGAVMFSSGNLEERARIARLTSPGETVIDLFAGIGYFTLPVAVHAKPAKVVACEVNPTAFHYLTENIRVNRAGSVDARLGDCRSTAPRGIADRVILGHFDADTYLDTAFEAARERATLHVHGLHRSPGAGRETPALAEGPVAKRLAAAAVRHGFELGRVASRFVKWYGPHRFHFVLDVEVARR